MQPRAALAAATSLLLLAGNAAAHAPLPEIPVSAAADQQVPLDWPTAPADGTQTSFRVRHNAADGTVVGMSLQQSRFPSLLLRVEVVPPGYRPAVETDQQHSPAAPVIDQNLRTVHKLSLRYRF